MDREEALNLLQNGLLPQVHGAYHDALDMAIKALEQQPCEDCISRKDAIKQCGFGMTSLLIADNLRRLPPVTPQQAVNERTKTHACVCISKQAVINTLFYASDNNCDVVLSTELMNRINSLPPVTPQPRTGKWEIHFILNERYLPKFTQICICKRCGGKLYRYEGQDISFCPSCGAKMEEGE